MQALVLSSDSREEDLHSIVSSTAAVVFMGTPHRGSKDWASVGERGRKLASALLMNNNPSLLDTLGLKNGELFRTGDKFAEVWDTSNFTVKTYQEGRAFTGAGIGHLGDKVRGSRPTPHVLTDVLAGRLRRIFPPLQSKGTC